MNAVVVVLIATTACASGAVIKSAQAPTSTSTSLAANTTLDPAVDALEEERSQALGLLATEIEAEVACVVDQFGDVAMSELDSAGIRATEADPALWDRAIGDAGSPVLDPLMLTLSLCTDFFEQLVKEDLTDLLEAGEIDCIVRNGRYDPNIVALHVAGTRDGTTIEEAYPPAMVAKLRRGLAARSGILSTMRALGRCPSSDLTL